MAEAVGGTAVGRATAAAGVVAALPAVSWVVAVGGNASGVAGAVAVLGLLVGFGGCLAGSHTAPAVAGVVLAAAVVIALAGSGSDGVRLDAGPVAVMVVAATELWGWSLDHRADQVTRDALARRARTLGLVTCLGLAGSMAVPLLAGAGGGGLTLRAAAVALVVGAMALLVRDAAPDR